MSALDLVRTNPDAERSRRATLARGQSLSLHGLPEHRPLHHCGCRSHPRARRQSGVGGMYPFVYHRPKSLTDVRTLLGASGNPRLLAGGMTLLPTMKLRLAEASDLIDLAAVEGLDVLRADGDGVEIGAMCRHAEVAANGRVRTRDSGTRGPGRRYRRSSRCATGERLEGSIANSDPRGRLSSGAAGSRCDRAYRPARNQRA